MKLETEVAAPNPVIELPADIENSADTGIILQSGIKCAKEGNRLQARQLLLRVTEADPENESAWLWLASISEYPEELLVFLQNVLNINPDNERALEWTKATEELLSKTFVQRGINASQENQKAVADQCFMQALRYASRGQTRNVAVAAEKGEFRGDFGRA
jgi:Tfp pilus assembly protein PilF